jgi:hypothetical protein
MMKMFSKTLLLLALMIGADVHAGADSGAALNLDFLLGRWQVTSTSTGSDWFRKDLGGRLIIRTAQSATSSEPGAATMNSLMTIYADSGKIRAIYFDDAGHVVRYTATRLSETAVQFVSGEADKGPRFRLTYSRSENGRLAVRFEMAAPENRTDFRVVAQAIESQIR